MKPTKIHGFISDRDIMIAVASNIIGVLTLSFPRIIAQDTNSTDGLLSILLGGGIACFLAWFLAKIATSFPNQSFFTFSSYLLSKPITIILMILLLIRFISYTSFQVREVTVLAHQYLFDKTPMEVISLSYLLVVVYAVSGSRAGLFRLCVLFFPIIIGGLLMVIILPIGLVKVENLLPVFQTDFQGYVKSTFSSVSTFLGFNIVLFYSEIIKEPKKAPKMAGKGVLIAVILNLFVYVICIGTFANATTRNLFFPTFELSRTVEIPGGFFERFDSILFVIWIIIIFTTTIFTLDLIIIVLMMLFKKAKKMSILFIMSPIIFLISMLPINYIELIEIAEILNYYSFIVMIMIIILLGVAYKIKGGSQN